MSRSLIPTLKLSLDMTSTLADIEHNGLKVNPTTLAEIREQFTAESAEIERRLQDIIWEVMGDTPINLESPDDRSLLLYSRRVINKTEWAETFNLGHELRGASKKPKRRVQMTAKEFGRAVKNNTEVIRRSKALQCPDCSGKGRVPFIKKDGTTGKAQRVCKLCEGKGVIYQYDNAVAGLKIVPRGVHDVANAGFKTDKNTLEEIRDGLSGVALEFCDLYMRYSKLRVYLNTFVDGLQNNLDGNDIVHPEFMQCVTATGRLSSRNPNFQNMPRGSTFEIRRCIESRWPGGQIIEGDYAQLEFRVAGFLAKDGQIYEDVLGKKDVHRQTASIINDKNPSDVTKGERQNAKAHTFAPLYGATGIGRPDHVREYYIEFKKIYEGVKYWQEDLQREAVSTKKIVLPSGREYSFPHAKWTKWGSATEKTSMCNYPVQGFATADLLPIALVKLHDMLKENNMQSVLCNTVHDSVVIDAHPTEIDDAIEIMKSAMLSVANGALERYGVRYDMPVEIEIKKGDDWLDTEDVGVFERTIDR